MCFGAELAWLAPLLAAGAGVAGTAIQQSEMQRQAEQQAEARNEVLRRTLLKNDTLAEDARDTFAKRLAQGNKDQVDQQQKNAAVARSKETTDAVKPTADMRDQQTASISGSAPDVVDSDLASRMKTAINEGTDRAKALSKLGSYGDSWLQQGFLDTQAGRDLGVTTNKAAGNSAILPYAQDFAEWKATEPISPLGSIISGLGNMYGSWAGSQNGQLLPRKTYTTPFIG